MRQKAVRRRNSSVAGQETKAARFARERDEALEQLSAASEVIKVISSSPGDLKSVFGAILENATRICQANFGTLYLAEGDAYRMVAMHNAPPAFAEFLRRRGPFQKPVPCGRKKGGRNSPVEERDQAHDALPRLILLAGLTASFAFTCPEARAQDLEPRHPLHNSIAARFELLQSGLGRCGRQPEPPLIGSMLAANRPSRLQRRP
jgi:hypothetical protein